MMEHRITVMPSGHEFRAVEQETLLEAALRSGLNINFSCSSGSCGDCRARLLEGELGEEDFHDHRFSATDKAQGAFLLCTAHAGSDLIIEAGEAKSTRDIPRQHITTKVGKIQEVGDHLRILQLKTPRTSPLRFLAGQHVELSLPGVGAIDSSIASCPCNGAQLQFHIPFDAHNPFVSSLFRGLRHGTTVEVNGPFGEMTLDDDSTRPLLMVAQDHSMASVKSLIEHAINLDVTQQVRFFWLAREGRHYMENFCRSWGEALDDYRFVALEYPQNESVDGQVRRVMAAIEEEVPTLGEWDIYWAGSAAFNQALQQQMLLSDADEQRLFSPRHRAVDRRQETQSVG